MALTEKCDCFAVIPWVLWILQAFCEGLLQSDLPIEPTVVQLPASCQEIQE